MGKDDAREVAIPSMIIPQISPSATATPFWSRGIPSSGNTSCGRSGCLDFDLEDFEKRRCLVDEELESESDSEEEEEEDSSTTYFNFRFRRWV
jgi:hypothetical protein